MASLRSVVLVAALAVVLGIGGGATAGWIAGHGPTTGLVGATGVTGSDGADGADGSDGADGAPGSQGVPGPAGSTGPQGATGPQGVTGPPGPPGTTGAQGIPGTPGSDGAPGADGTPGADGAPGSDGVVSFAYFTFGFIDLPGGAGVTPDLGTQSGGDPTLLTPLSATTLSVNQAGVYRISLGTYAITGAIPSNITIQSRLFESSSPSLPILSNTSLQSVEGLDPSTGTSIRTFTVDYLNAGNTIAVALGTGPGDGAHFRSGYLLVEYLG